jgi:3-hydroxyisobutyrate dehydrogenase-like beta-hydroxyacid dehydrogenase
MTWRSIGVLSPGEMGAAVATVLRAHGLRVVTCLEGRSARTRQRSETARLEVVSTLAQLVHTVEAVLSIVPTMSAPAVGKEIAQAITQTSKPISFIEANAISPMTSTTIEQTILRAGGRYIDGCIIGGVRDVGRSTMFYLSGPDAEVAAAALQAGGVQAEVLGGRAGQASAFKMGYAGFTKGTTALLLELTLMAHAWGFLDAILAKYASSHPEALRLFTAHVTTWPEYAAIRAEEMVELTATAKAAGLAPNMAPGAERGMAAMAQLGWDTNDAMDKAALERKLPLPELIRLLAAKELLKATEKAE